MDHVRNDLCFGEYTIYIMQYCGYWLTQSAKHVTTQRHAKTTTRAKHMPKLNIIVLSYIAHNFEKTNKKNQQYRGPGDGGILVVQRNSFVKLLTIIVDSSLEKVYVCSHSLC